MLKFFRTYHKWPGVILTVFILLFALSGIILNHRELLSPLDVNRKWLPDTYRYRNWNLAAVKGRLNLASDSNLIFGNIGVWLTDSTYTAYHDLNKGFPRGADNRKVASLAGSKKQGLYAGTLFGLFRFDFLTREWKLIPLPVKEKRVVKVLALGDSILVMTRSNLLVSVKGQNLGRFSRVMVPPAEDYDHKTGLFKTLWVIHSGEIYGTVGKVIVDLVGLTFIILSLTGLIYFFVPYALKRTREEHRSRLKRFNLFSLKWHNRLGSWLVVILLLTTLTGMFLRPPLLIPIASSRVGKLRHTELDDPNTWFDRFRDLVFDNALHRFLVASSEGIYYSDDCFNSRLKRFSYQPPISVMGINVFEVKSPGCYLAGSFSGMYQWIPGELKILDYFTKTPVENTGETGPPFGNVSVAGYIRDSGSSELLFDYGGGAISLSGSRMIPDMPDEIIRGSPISLWNTALEIHTGRIFEPVLGKFYILVVPLAGLSTVFILVTGFFSWYLKRKRVNRNPPQGC
jgi:hypothetical protein